MARHMQTRKRSRPVGFVGKRTFKRRRTTRGKKSSNFTSQSGKGGGITFRSRKVKAKTYRNLLWNSSILKTKYRTILSAVASPSTPGTTLTHGVTATSAINFGSAFWTAAGGAVSPDSSNALPTFTGNIVLRGGMIGCRITNTLDTTAASAGTIVGTMFLIRSTKNWTSASVPSTVTLGWDPTMIQDFATKIGKIYYKKTFLLRDAESALTEYRLRVSSIDEGDYFSFYNQFIWFIVYGNVDSSVTKQIVINTYYNMSFVADGV